mgnify:CR=1 FL=1
MTVEELKVIISAETKGFDKASKNTKKTITRMDKTINALHKKLQNAFNIRENNNRGIEKINATMEGLKKTANSVSGAVGAVGDSLSKAGKTSVSGISTDLVNAKKQAAAFVKDFNKIMKMDDKSPEFNKAAHDWIQKYQGFFKEGIVSLQPSLEQVKPSIDYEKLYKYVSEYTPEKDLKKSKQYVSDIQQQMKNIKIKDTGIKQMIKELASLEKKLKVVNKQRKKLLEPISNFMDVNKADPEVLRDTIPRLGDIDGQIADYKSKIKALEKSAKSEGLFSGKKFTTDSLRNELKLDDETLQQTSKTVETYKQRIKDLETYIKNAGTQSKKAAKSISKFSKALRMIKMSAGFMLISKIFSAITKNISECFTALMKFDKARNNILGYNNALSNLSSSAKKLGGELSIIGAQILQAIEPALTRIISLVNTVIIEVSRLFAIFTGKKQVAIVKDNYWKDYTDDVKGATAAQKKFVASFDELNIITKNSSGGGSSSSDSNLSEELFDIEDIKLTDFEQRLKDIFEKWKKTIPKIEFKFDKKKALSDVKDIIANIANVIGGVGSLVISIGIKIANDLNLGQLLNDILGLVNDFTYLASCITEALVPAFQTFYDYGISPIVEVLGDTFHSIITTVGGWFRSWGDLFIELAPVFETIAKVLGKIVGFIGETLALIAEAAWEIFAFCLETIGNILKSFAESTVGQAILTGLGTALGLILLVNGAVTVFSGIMKVAQGIIGAVKGAMALFNAILAANPITLVIAAIAGLVAAFVYLWNNCDSFREFWIKLWDKIKTAASNVVNWFKNDVPAFFQNCFDKVHTALNNLKSWFSNIFDSIKQKVNNVVDNIKNAISGAINKVKQLFGYSDSSVTISTKTNGRKPATQNTKAIATPFAKGGVIKTPTLGLVGEYAGAKSNPEIIAPQSVITDIIDSRNDEMISVITQLFRQAISAIENQDMSVSIGDETIARSAARGNKANIYRTGKSLF